MAVAAVMAVAGAVAASPGGHGPGAPAPAGAAQASMVPVSALTSSWSCAGATMGPHSALPGRLVLSNAAPRPVQALVRLVTSDGHHYRESTAVPAGGTTTLPETVPDAAAGAWVGAMVTLYGGMASVTQQVRSRWGDSGQPCASTASGTWYFPYGQDLRNAGEYLSLVNPYPADVIADLSFSTELGREQPGAFQGLVVPADGMTVVGLSSALRPRAHISVSVHARSGGIAAFETELVTPPLKHAPLLGTPGALNPVDPQAGVTLELGAPQAQTDWWWPEGGAGGGVTESYEVFNPGPRTARVNLQLLTQGTAKAAPGAVGGSDQLVVAPYSSAQVTTNGQPWALSGTEYATELKSTNGVPVAAERAVTVGPPAARRGLGATLGLTGAGRAWLVRGPAGPGALSVQVSNPGLAPASLQIDVRDKAGDLTALPGLADLDLGAGSREGIQLPGAAEDRTLVLTSTVPLLVEQGPSTKAATPAGVGLTPAVPLAAVPSAGAPAAITG